MTAMLLLALALTAGPEVETSPVRSTRLYVRTLPPGAEVQVDGHALGRSDGLFLVPPGTHKLTAELSGFAGQLRQVEILDGRITRVEITFEPPASNAPAARPSPGTLPEDPFAIEEPTPIHWVADDRVYLGYVHDTSEKSRSLNDGCVVRFQRPAESNQLLAVEIFACDTHLLPGKRASLQVVVLDEHLRVIRRKPVPSPDTEPGRLQWTTLALEPTEVPERFLVAILAAPNTTSDFVVGIDTEVAASHSYTGTPDKGLTTMDDKSDWMVRAVLAPPPRNAEVN